MPLKTTNLSGLGVVGTVYDMEFIGDELPLHVHTKETKNNHISIVARGSYRVEGHESYAGKILMTGDVADWPINMPHAFVALEDNSRLVNIVKSNE